MSDRVAAVLGVGARHDLLTGASAAQRGRANFSALAETYWLLHSQDPRAWS